ncbi:MAG: CHAT domain-containing protein [Prochloraceae cyanobacterium]|nr:CHAT domain-containing protein [Prochloraceae cyanobacterium]
MKKIFLIIGLFLMILGGDRSCFSREQTNLKSNPNLELEAENFYQNKQYDRAIDRLKAAIKNYQITGNLVGAINARRNLALVYQAKGDWQQAKQAIETNLKEIDSLERSAIKQELNAESLEVLGKINLAIGDSQKSLEAWEKATKIYQKLGNKIKENKSKINLAIAQSSLGLYNRASKNLLSLKKDLETQPERIKIATLLQLGNIFRKIGNLAEAELTLKESLSLAKLESNSDNIARILISLGNLERVKQNQLKAIDYYQQAINLSNAPEITIRARLSQLSWLIKRNSWDEKLIAEVDKDLEKLSISRTKIYAQINLANNIVEYLKQNKQLNNDKLTKAEALLKSAIATARQIGDRRSQSYANGTLGHLYEVNNRDREAQKLTEIALMSAIELNSPDLSYQWQWQLGRILQKQGQTQSAIAAYSQAVNNLQLLRGDLVAISDEVKFTFSESVEPVYRELADLLLKSDRPSQENLRRARKVIEALQLARLNNYFREACLDTVPQQIDRIDKEASVIYSIILPDRLALILSLPGKPLSYRVSALKANKTQVIDRAIDNLYLDIGPSLSLGYNKEPYQELYDLLIRPIDQKLQENQVKTLVFVLDGILQRVPVAALFDGEKYLIEKYNVVLTPGLQLLKSPTLSPERLSAIFAGISESRAGFAPLPGVKQEAREIAEVIPTDILLDREFTSDRLQTKIGTKAFPIVHLATHGQFSSAAEDTFLLAWDRKINVKDLDRLLGARDRQRQSPIELLILSACETAEGDNRAVLGIAGVAVRSGARSTIATLWPVQDDSTVLLMDRLYTELNKPGINKAEALRNAQISLLKDSHFDRPFFWAGFVLIGNWL